MTTGQATIIKRNFEAIGAGLIQTAAEQEGGKGCSPIFCTEPVVLEPTYERFDSNRIIHGPPNRQPGTATPPALSKWKTIKVFAAPEDILSLGWIESLLRALSHLKHPIIFELAGNRDQVSVRFAVDESDKDGFKAGILGLFPAIELKEVDCPFPENQLASVEEAVPVGPYHRHLTLIGREGASPLSIAIWSLGQLDADSFGLFQVLIQPADPDHDWHYNTENLIDAESRAKNFSQLGGLSPSFAYDSLHPPRLEPETTDKVHIDVAFFAVVVRFAIWSSCKLSTRAFHQGMRAGLSVTRFGNRSWRILDADYMKSALGMDRIDAMVRNRNTHRNGLMITSREVATLVHLPNPRTLEMYPNLIQRTGLRWNPYPEETLEEGAITIGYNTYVDEIRDIRIPLEQRLMHMYVTGGTGSGKTTAIENMVHQDIEQGMGLCLVDPHGDLIWNILSRIPEHRMKDLVYVSFAEANYTPKFNPFRNSFDPGKVADDTTRAFLAGAGVSGARMEHNYRMLSYSICVLGGTLQDLSEMVIRNNKRGEDLRLEAISKVSNRQVLRFLESELPSFRPAELESVRNKLSRLLTNRHLAITFAEPENAVQPRRWMDESSIVLINLSSGSLGGDSARFAGGLIVSLIHRAALSRADIPESQRKPFMLYLDEVQKIQTASLDEMLSEARKYGMGVILAHQEAGQLNAALTQAIGNCATRIVLRVPDTEAPQRRKTLLGKVSEADLTSLGVGEGFIVNGDRIASLKTRICTKPVLRDSRNAGHDYAVKNYIEIGTNPDSSPPEHPTSTRRERAHNPWKGRTS